MQRKRAVYMSPKGSYARGISALATAAPRHLLIYRVGNYMEWSMGCSGGVCGTIILQGLTAPSPHSFRAAFCRTRSCFKASLRAVG
jgi:hypothetical protein